MSEPVLLETRTYLKTKMRSSSVACLFALCLLSLLQIGTSYKCYACAGVSGSDDVTPPIPGLDFLKACADPVDEDKLKTKVDCSGEKNACVKIVSKVEDVEVYMRNCMPKVICDTYKDCETCEDDLCNSSSTVMPSFALVCVFAVLFYKFAF